MDPSIKKKERNFKLTINIYWKLTHENCFWIVVQQNDLKNEIALDKNGPLNYFTTQPSEVSIVMKRVL